jgi:hypothetical protein
MSIESVRHQLQVTLEIPESRIAEWGVIRHALYAYFGKKLHVSDKAQDGTVKLTCTYSQLDPDLSKYEMAVHTFHHLVTPILRIEEQEQLPTMEDERQETAAGDSDASIPGTGEPTKDDLPF